MSNPSSVASFYRFSFGFVKSRFITMSSNSSSYLASWSYFLSQFASWTLFDFKSKVIAVSPFSNVSQTSSISGILSHTVFTSNENSSFFLSSIFWSFLSSLSWFHLSYHVVNGLFISSSFFYSSSTTGHIVFATKSSTDFSLLNILEYVSFSQI